MQVAKALKYTECGPSISEADIDHFQRRIGRPLPSDYREFLLQYNGGCPEPCTVDIPGHDEGCVDVRTLFGVLEKREVSGLSWNYAEYSKQFGPDFLPIARTDTNDIFFLNLGDDDPGIVQFWDSMEENSAMAMYRLGDSFSDFLGKIYEGD